MGKMDSCFRRNDNKTMAVKKPIKRSAQKRDITFPFERSNVMILAAGIGILILGYILMAGNSVDGFTQTILSPIVLIFGYCVVIPYGILKKPVVQETAFVQTAPETLKQETNVKATAAAKSGSNVKTSSNIKTK